MEKSEIFDRISNGEDSYTQFKEKAVTAKELAKEFVAFSNAEGGILIFGVADNCEIKGLSKHEIEKIGQLVGNTANENVKPPIHPLIQNLTIDDKKITIVFIKNGSSKPYATSSGDYYTKSGSDKKKVSQEELRRLFAESNRLFADEETIYNSNINDLNAIKFRDFLKTDNPIVFNKFENKELDLETILQNLELYKNDHLTLAGNLLFGENPQQFNPSFYIDCCYFDGNDISTTKFISKQTIKGTFPELFEDSLRFVKSQLRSYQVEKDFNSNSKLEIDENILIELIINALIHRDYYIESSIKIFLFYDRLEIISPGKLPNSLTVEKIKNGISIHRNPILSSISKILLPYTGYGSGIKRVLALDPEIEFINDITLEQFTCVIRRTDKNKLGNRSEKLGNQSEKLGNQSEKLGNQSEKLGNTKEHILLLLKQDSKITISTLAEKIGITTTAIENNIKYLKEHNYLRRVGGTRGHWEIIDK